MKIFWWTQVDELTGNKPLLFYHDENGNTQQVYSDAQTSIQDMLMQGYQEISTRTAYELGMI